MEQRQIKFMAWHKTIREIMPVYEICWKSKKKEPHIVTNKGWIGLNENVVLIRFTELYDKNGKEIYEGFVVRGRDTYINQKGVFEHLNNTPVEYEVYFDTEMGMWELKDLVFGEKYEEIFGCKAKEFEIIGNIFEMPKQ